jgi:hypothetical protein
MTSERGSERKALASFIHDAIDKGATTVEEIHKSIADLPLKMLEESELLRESAKEVRRVQDHTIGAIYDVIRGSTGRSEPWHRSCWPKRPSGAARGPKRAPSITRQSARALG